MNNKENFIKWICCKAQKRNPNKLYKRTTALAYVSALNSICRRFPEIKTAIKAVSIFELTNISILEDILHIYFAKINSIEDARTGLLLYIEFLLDFYNVQPSENETLSFQKYMQKESTELLSQEKFFNEGLEQEINYIKRARNHEIVNNVKVRDEYKCQCCNFFYKSSIVHAHHLKPMSEKPKGEYRININEFITLCPTCHSLAHLLLKDDTKYANKEILVAKLKEIQAEVKSIF